MNDNVSRRGSSSSRSFVVALVVVVVLLAALRWAVQPDPRTRNLEFMPEMVTSPAVETQAVCAALPGGVSQHGPVAGVVIRGELPLHYAAVAEEAERAGRELKNPFDATDEAALARGAEVYRIHCASCHDLRGDGRGPAVQRGMLQPPSMKAANALAMADGRLFHVMTYGQGNMPPMGARISRDDRWRAVLHVKVLQKGVAR